MKPKERTYGNWRKPRSAGLGPLGLLPTIGLFVALICALIGYLARGYLGAGVVLVAAVVVLVPLVIKDRHGISGLERVGILFGYWRARRARRNLYRSGPLGRVPWGVAMLPGVAARMELSEAEDGHGRQFGILRLKTTNHYAVSAIAEPDGSSLVDQEQVDRWVAGWGQWLSTLADEPGIVGAQVTVESAPDTGTRLAGEVLGQLSADAPELAQTMLREVVRDYPHGSASVRAWVTLTFSGTRNGKRRKPDEVARDLASRMPGIVSGLQRCGAGAARPMAAQEWAETIRIAYDPRSELIIQQAKADQSVDTPEIWWHDCGPTATETRWNSYRHDSAVSRSWTMTGAPRGEVFSSVLEQLLAPHPDVQRKRVTMLYKPLNPSLSARLVETDRRNADFRVASADQPSARMIAEQRSATLTAQEEARGAALVDFGCVITATVSDETELAVAEAAIDNLAASARLQIRPAYGAQDAAFVSGLPLGLVMSTHLRVPSEVREAL